MAIPPGVHPPPRTVSVVVPVRNGAETIGEQLAALAAQTYAGRWEVVVADNGSTDTTAAVARGWAARLPALTVVDASGPAGPGFARNRGAQHATGDFLAFCDADDVVDPAWLASLTAAARDFDVVAGPLEAGVVNTDAVAASRPPRATGLARAARFLPFAPSGNFGVWADVFARTGGFDGRYSQSEDVEWSWRAQLTAGATIGFAPGAVVHYRYRTSPRGVVRQAYGRGVSGARLFRAYRARGLERPSLTGALRTWLWLVVRLPGLADPEQRLTWIRRAGEAAGRASGSIRFRVLFL